MTLVLTVPVLLVAAGLVAGGCSPAVNRRGYVAVNPADAKSCRVAVKSGAAFSPDEVEELGQVEVGDSGLTMTCDEATMVGLLRSEGCSAGAQVVDILRETRPDFASTCYRAQARLLRFRDPSRVATDDPRFATQAMQARGKADSSGQSAMLWGAVGAAVAAGVVAGIVVGTR